MKVVDRIKRVALNSVITKYDNNIEYLSAKVYLGAHNIHTCLDELLHFAKGFGDDRFINVKSDITKITWYDLHEIRIACPSKDVLEAYTLLCDITLNNIGDDEGLCYHGSYIVDVTILGVLCRNKEIVKCYTELEASNIYDTLISDTTVKDGLYSDFMAFYNEMKSNYKFDFNSSRFELASQLESVGLGCLTAITNALTFDKFAIDYYLDNFKRYHLNLSDVIIDKIRDKYFKAAVDNLKKECLDIHKKDFIDKMLAKNPIDKYNNSDKMLIYMGTDENIAIMKNILEDYIRVSLGIVMVRNGTNNLLNVDNTSLQVPEISSDRTILKIPDVSVNDMPKDDRGVVKVSDLDVIEEDVAKPIIPEKKIVFVDKNTNEGYSSIFEYSNKHKVSLTVAKKRLRRVDF